MRRLLIIIWLVLPLGVAWAQQPKVYLDIYSPAFRRFPIAITELKDSGSTGDVDQVRKGIVEVLGNDLEISGLFRILDPILFLEDPKRAGITKDKINFTDWVAINAEALVKGGVQLKGEDLKIEFRLFDVFRQRQIIGVRYTGSKDDWRRMTHKFANEIIARFTGEAGVFDTMLTFIGTVGDAKEIFIMDYDGYGLRRLTKTGSINISPNWSPDGKNILFTSYLRGSPDLYLLRLEEGKLLRVAGFPGLNLAADWSPKGDKIALTLTKDGNAEIYVMNADGSGMKRLTDHWAIDISPTWSPDAKSIAFVSDRSGSPQIYIISAKGGKPRRITFQGRYNASPAWSPRGDKIAFSGSFNGRFGILLINPDGTGLTRLTHSDADDRYPSFSPDGRYIAFSSKKGGKSRLYIASVNGSLQRRIEIPLDHASHPAWSPRLR